MSEQTKQSFEDVSYNVKYYCNECEDYFEWEDKFRMVQDRCPNCGSSGDITAEIVD